MSSPAPTDTTVASTPASVSSTATITADAFVRAQVSNYIGKFTLDQRRDSVLKELKKYQLEDTVTLKDLMSVVRSLNHDTSMRTTASVHQLSSNADAIVTSLKSLKPLKGSNKAGKAPALMYLRNFHKDFVRDSTKWLAAQGVLSDPTEHAALEIDQTTQGLALADEEEWYSDEEMARRIADYADDES